MDGITLTPPPTDYEADFHAWSMDQAKRLRALHVPGLDTENLAEEIESLGRRDRLELVSRMNVLLTHLLKWQFQPDRRGRSWIVTIGHQRRAIERVLSESPSLRPAMPEILPRAFSTAIREAADETGLPRQTFPSSCPWSLEQALDEDWLPAD